MQKILFIFIFIVGFVSCETDVDVNGPYEDVTVVYGLLNQQEDLHFIKINKIFAGRADVRDMAQVRDSSEYDAADLSVQIMEMGGQNRIFNLKDTLITNKEAGYFYAPEQQLFYFKTSQPLNDLNDNVTYQLIIKNKLLNKEISATTKLVKPFVIEVPGAAPEKKIGFADDKGLLIAPTKVRWKSAKDGKRYDVKMVFNYLEVNAQGDTIKPKPIEWTKTGIKSATVAGGETLESEFSSLEFYSKLQKEIPDNASVQRLAYSLDFYIYAAAHELNTYMEVSEPSSGLVQDKPSYSNLKNAIGVFSARNYQVVANKGLSSGTARFLKISEYTQSKNFVKYYNFAGTPQYFEIF